MAEGTGPELMALFQQGSPKAFGAVWKEFYAQLVYFCDQIVQDKEVAKEIASDSLTKCLLKKDDFGSFPQLRAFLYIAARNGAIDYIRHQKRVHEKQKAYLATSGQDLANQEIDGELIKALSHSIEKLPPRSKEVIRLLYHRELSYQQIADLMKISINTVTNIRAYALKIMREDFRNKDIELLVSSVLLLFCLL